MCAGLLRHHRTCPVFLRAVQLYGECSAEKQKGWGRGGRRVVLQGVAILHLAPGLWPSCVGAASGRQPFHKGGLGAFPCRQQGACAPSHFSRVTGSPGRSWGDPGCTRRALGAPGAARSLGEPRRPGGASFEPRGTVPRGPSEQFRGPSEQRGTVPRGGRRRVRLATPLELGRVAEYGLRGVAKSGFASRVVPRVVGETLGGRVGRWRGMI